MEYQHHSNKAVCLSQHRQSAEHTDESQSYCRHLDALVIEYRINAVFVYLELMHYLRS